MTPREEIEKWIETQQQQCEANIEPVGGVCVKSLVTSYARTLAMLRVAVSTIDDDCVPGRRGATFQAILAILNGTEGEAE